MNNDLISRKELLEWFTKNVGLTDKVDNREIHEVIERMPAANQWIPCSEKMPEYGKEVLATFKIDDEYEVAKAMPIECDIWGERPAEDVVAWMPLPEPYESNRSNSSN